jgi:hypothetical protein
VLWDLSLKKKTLLEISLAETSHVLKDARNIGLTESSTRDVLLLYFVLFSAMI